MGSRVPGGIRTMSLLMERDLAARRVCACSMGAPNAFSNCSGVI
jgi:hypothetical protein